MLDSKGYLIYDKTEDSLVKQLSGELPLVKKSINAYKYTYLKIPEFKKTELSNFVDKNKL